MARHLQLGQTEVAEKFGVFAPFTPCESWTTFYLPDDPSADYDLSGTTNAREFSLRLIPHHWETTPDWQIDLITNVSGMRNYLKAGAKIISIPPGHRALTQYTERRITYMVEGGANVNIYGRGWVHANFYGFDEDGWKDPQVGIDYQVPHFNGYISERFLECTIDGIGQRRVKGLSRLVERANETREISRELRETGTCLSTLDALCTKKQLADEFASALAARSSATIPRGEVKQVECEFQTPDDDSKTPNSCFDNKTPTAPAPNTLPAPSSATSKTPASVAHSKAPAAKSRLPPRKNTSPTPPKASKPSESLASTATTTASEAQGVAAQAGALPTAQKRSPPAKLPSPGPGTSAATNAKPEIKLVVTTKGSGNVRGPTPPSKGVARKVSPPTAANGEKSKGMSAAQSAHVKRTRADKARNAIVLIPVSSLLVAPPMARSPVMEVVEKPGKASRHLSGAQRRKLKKLAALTAAAITATTLRNPVPPPAETPEVARTRTISALKELLERRRQDRLDALPVVLASNGVHELVSTPSSTLENSGVASAPLAAGRSRLQKGYAGTKANEDPSADAGSRKRPTTPPQPTHRGNTESLFGKSARLNQRDDWRTSNGYDGRSQSRSSPYQHNISPRRSSPSRYQNSLYPTTPTRPPPRGHQDSYLWDSQYDNYYYGRSYDERRGNTGLERPIHLHSSRPSTFETGGYYPGGFNNRYAGYFSPIMTLPYQPWLHSTLNYDEYHPARPAPGQAFVTKVTESPSSRQPIATPSIPSGGPKLCALADVASETLKETTSSSPHKTDSSTTFSRAISPPPTSKYSLRPTATSFFPAQTTSTAPTPASTPLSLPAKPSSASSALLHPLPAKPTTAPLSKSIDPRRTSTTYSSLFHHTPAAPPVIGTPIFVANTSQLITKGSDDEDSKMEGIVKIEEGEIVESGLETDGWEVVKKKNKVNSQWLHHGAQALTQSRKMKAGESAGEAGRVRTRHAKTGFQVANRFDCLQDANSPAIGPVRPSLRRASPFRPTLSSIGSVPIDDEWSTDMDVETSGESYCHQSDAWDAAKTNRQTKLAKNSRKTRRQRESAEFFKWLGQEELRLWENFKKEHGCLRIGGLRKKEWVSVSGPV
ncbi:hypothetical protein P7C70_g4778, partial [Phenoliferia sp. Uapishka_3]